VNTDLVRVPVVDVDGTYLGLPVLVTSAGTTRKGGVSDVHRCTVGDLYCPETTNWAQLFRVVVTHTHLWFGGFHVVLRDDDVVLAPVPSAARERSV
jgi:hypothetical protein